MQSVKNENRSLLLYLLAAEGSLSRKEIAKRLKLTPAAVTKICADLIENGFIRECGAVSESGKSGRKEIMLELCLDDKYVFGINAERNGITFSLICLNGKLVSKKKISLTENSDKVIEEAKAYFDEINPENVLAAGVCVIGSSEENNFGIWKDKRFAKKLEAALGVPVAVENNVKAFAEAELIYGKLQNRNSALFLKWGAGVGSAIIANGKVFSGSDSSVAEIGHYIVNSGGVRCRCGRYGCLETEVSEEAILKQANSEKTIDELLNNCDNIIDEKIDMVALALTNTSTILNANTIVLFGKMFTFGQVAEKVIRQCMRYNNNLSSDMISVSSLNEKSDYIGALAICSKRFFFESEVF